MKRRSQPKQSKSRGTYARKKAEGNMMYGANSHTRHQYRVRPQGDGEQL